ncbi:hypothetical protein, partial [Klebsiella pneumoniae]|uniref:hypothetical protein n=1 Tax=Klebsiella pneumoniae TaxID=573 RepID=UPI00300451EB
KACVLPENPASYRVVRTKSYLFNKALAQLTVRAVPEADLAYCQVSVFTGSRSARLGISIIEY